MWKPPAPLLPAAAQVKLLREAMAEMPSAPGKLPDFLKSYAEPDDKLVLIDQD